MLLFATFDSQIHWHTVLFGSVYLEGRNTLCVGWEPIDLAAVQNQSLELWLDSLKAGGFRFLYRSLLVLNTEGFWFAVLDATGQEAP